MCLLWLYLAFFKAFFFAEVYLSAPIHFVQSSLIVAPKVDTLWFIAYVSFVFTQLTECLFSLVLSLFIQITCSILPLIRVNAIQTEPIGLDP